MIVKNFEEVFLYQYATTGKASIPLTWKPTEAWLWVFILSWNVSGDLIGATYQTLISNSIPSCHKIFMVLNILTSEKDPQMTFVSTEYLCFARLSLEGLSNYYFWDFWGFSRPNPLFPAVSLFQRMMTTVISDVIKVGINFSRWQLRLRRHCTV